MNKRINELAFNKNHKNKTKLSQIPHNIKEIKEESDSFYQGFRQMKYCVEINPTCVLSEKSIQRDDRKRVVRDIFRGVLLFLTLME